MTLMSDAVIGLIGVLIGGGISTGASLLLEERRYRRARRDEQGLASRRHLQAARLIQEELSDISLTLAGAIDSDRWWPLPGQALPVERWREFGPALAETD